MLGSELPAQLNVQLFLWYICIHHFVSFSVSLTLFQLPSLVGARVSRHPQASRVGISPSSSCRCCMSFPPPQPGYVTSHPAKSLCQHTFSQSHTQFFQSSSLLLKLLPFGRHMLLICLCYAMCLKCCAFRSVGIPSHSFCWIVGVQGVLTFMDPCSVPRYTYASSCKWYMRTFCIIFVTSCESELYQS